MVCETDNCGTRLHPKVHLMILGESRRPEPQSRYFEVIYGQLKLQRLTIRPTLVLRLGRFSLMIIGVVGIATHVNQNGSSVGSDVKALKTTGNTTVFSICQ